MQNLNNIRSKFIIPLLLILFWGGNIKAQMEKRQLTTKEFIALDDSLAGSISLSLYLWTEAHYSAYLTYTKEVNRFFHFEEDDSKIIPPRIRSILLENKDSFSLIATDSSFTIYYNDQLFLEIIGRTYNCLEISESFENRRMVKTFDETGIYIWNEDLINSFREDIVRIYRKFIEGKYTTLIFPKDTNYVAASTKPLVIVYQYEKLKGLSIHKICSSNYVLQQNPYTKSLSELAERYCEEYKLSKIIFAARVMEKED